MNVRANWKNQNDFAVSLKTKHPGLVVILFLSFIIHNDHFTVFKVIIQKLDEPGVLY